MGASTHQPKSATRAEKLAARAKARRVTSGSRAAKPKRAAGSRSGGAGKLWAGIFCVALASAAVGAYLSNPAKARTMLGELGQRFSAAGDAFVGGEEKSTPKKKPALAAGTGNPQSAASLAKPALVTSKPDAAKEKDKAKTAEKEKDKEKGKPAAPASLWSAAEEKDLYNALGRRDHEGFRKLVRAHQERLPLEAGMDQDILTTAVARGKVADVKFMLGAGISPDRLIKTPAEPMFLQLVGNSAFAEIAKSDKNVTLLMLAAAAGDDKMIVHLQSQGARNRSTTLRKYTALDFAVASEKAGAIQACLGRRPGDESTRILVSLKERTATFFADGRIQQRSWVSTGRAGHPTPTGRFVITQKHRDWTSTKYHVKMPYFLRLNNGAIGLHAGNVPPYPASHGCIRLPDEQAKTFFQMADIGTIVDIVN